MANPLSIYADRAEDVGPFAEPGSTATLAEFLKAQSIASGDANDEARRQVEAGDAFGRGVVAAYRQNRLANFTSSQDAAMAEAADHRIKTVQDQTGVQLQNPFRDGYFREATERLDAAGGAGNLQDNRYAGIIAEQRRIFDEKMGEVIANFPDKAPALNFGQPIEDQARAITQAAEYAGDHAEGGLLASFVGGAAAAVRDPLQMTALLATGGESVAGTALARIGWTALRQGLLNAGIAAVEQPSVQEWRADAGIRSGVVPSLENIGMNFVIGGVLGGAVHGGVELVRAEKEALIRVATGAGRPGDIETAAKGLGVPIDADTAATIKAAEADVAHAALARSDLPGGILPGDRSIFEGLPARFEGLSQLQLADLAAVGERFTLDADARAVSLGREVEALARDRAGLAPRTARSDALSAEISQLDRDLQSVNDRITAHRPPTDPETDARLAVIDQDLAMHGLRAADRDRLIAERRQIQETVAVTAPQDTGELASLAQERLGLERALSRKRSDLTRLEKAVTNRESDLGAREADIGRRQSALAQKRSSDVAYVENEMRRAITRYAREGYNLDLSPADAREMAQLVLTARGDELPAMLSDLGRTLRFRAWASDAEAGATQALRHAEDPLNEPRAPTVGIGTAAPDIAGAERVMQHFEGRPIDGVAVLRASPEMIEGALRSRDPGIVQSGRLAALSDEAWSMVADGRVPPEHGIIAAELSPDISFDAVILSRLADARPADVTEARLIAADEIEREASRRQRAEIALAESHSAVPAEPVPHPAALSREPSSVAAALPDGSRRDVMDLVPMLRDDGTVLLATPEAVAAIADHETGLANLVRACNL